MTRESHLHFSESGPFSVQLERPVNGAGAGFFGQPGEGLSGASGYGLSQPARTGVPWYHPALSCPTPSVSSVC